MISRFFITFIHMWLFVLCCLFCLWVLSVHLVNDTEPELAILLFPFALRIGLVLHCPKKYWLAIYGAEWALLVAIFRLYLHIEWIYLFAASFVSLPILTFAYDYYKGNQWNRLCVIGLVIIVISFTNSLCYLLFYDDFGISFLCSVTGSLIIVPSCYLIWSYFFQNSWRSLTVDFIEVPLNSSNRSFFLYLIIFISSIVAQISLPDELQQFAPFCLAIPIIFLAFYYGWQGSLLATLFNSFALIAIQKSTGFSMTTLFLSLSAQTLTGILLGAAIQRQRDLNTQLSQELNRNQKLVKQLVKSEEVVRRDIARELHDEIGQNVTAIRIQASLLQRVGSVLTMQNYAQTIEKLSLNIYDATRGLLNRLRPKALDDLGLEEAIHQLVSDLEFGSQQIGTSIYYAVEDKYLNDTLSATIFRICQELLNNIIKYAKASEVSISVFQKMIGYEHKYYLIITDNGIGFKEEDKLHGYGLRGIEERVQALGGSFTITSNSANHQGGARLKIELPFI